MCFFSPLFFNRSEGRSLLPPSIHPSVWLRLTSSLCLSGAFNFSFFHKNKTKKEERVLIIVVLLLLLQAKSGIIAFESFQLPFFVSLSAGESRPSTFNLWLQIAHKLDDAFSLVVYYIVLWINRQTSTVRRLDRCITNWWAGQCGHVADLPEDSDWVRLWGEVSGNSKLFQFLADWS